MPHLFTTSPPRQQRLSARPEQIKTIYGTGPFMLESVSPKEKMTVKRFEQYWGEKSRLDKVCLNIIRNPATRMLAFESGQVDLAVNYPEMDAKRLSSQKGIKIFTSPTNRLCFFFVRIADGPLADIRVRQALNYAIDRREIIQTVLAGFGGKIGASVFPDHLPWCNRSLPPWSHDLEKAKALLKDAGAVDSDHDGILEIAGKPLVLNAWTYEGRAAMKPLLELLQVQLAKAGIATKLKVTRKGSPINRAMQNGEVQLNLQMWNVAPQGDPDFFLSNLFVSQAASNYMGYENSEIDDLVKKGKATFDPVQRKKIYDRIQEIIYNESPVIVLFHKSMISVAHDNVHGYRIHPAEKYLLTPEIYKQ
jgi:peptide/nickel transport system substrate-binding protein